MRRQTIFSIIAIIVILLIGGLLYMSSSKSEGLQDRPMELPDRAQQSARQMCYNGAQDQIKPEELLPEQDPYKLANTGTLVPFEEAADFLQAGQNYAINTQDGSLRNANYQLRPDPPIPKTFEPSAFTVSTITPDTIYNENLADVMGACA